MVFFPPPSLDNEWDSEEEDGIADQHPLDVCCVPVNSFQLVVSSLPGRRCAGIRRSLVADIGIINTIPHLIHCVDARAHC
ncbi:hypothetical protein GBAR_LOCUS24037 [Geodia barretti]|uniref:Uncharacterized protein n=1 Tax=Geodia barretti TaxID=519541 RepID=A0AA35T8P4_GEOBA|nr:hypothetical protein GBAR_LOCUS24037 [Geodia barretti]